MRDCRGSSATTCAAARPIILYAAASHFRQTNAVDGLIGEGTGGVTEGLKRRVVLPMSGSLADTDHVLGHELVHAFQFDLTGTDPRETNWAAQTPGILAFPLWFVEGMAEYLSLGPVDTQTAMWLRDAALREKLPHVQGPRPPRVLSVPLGTRVLGVSWAPSTAIARWRRSFGRPPIRASISLASRASSAPTPTRSRPSGTPRFMLSTRADRSTICRRSRVCRAWS